MHTAKCPEWIVNQFAISGVADLMREIGFDVSELPESELVKFREGMTEIANVMVDQATSRPPGAILPAFILWLRNHIDVGDPKIKAKVIERADAVLVELSPIGIEEMVKMQAWTSRLKENR